jgi:hypothetical protein
MLEVVTVIEHTKDCAIHEDGPCTCGAEEAYDEILMDEFQAELTAEDFE